jgi:hypothetical protein
MVIDFIETLDDESRQIRQTSHKIVEALEVDAELRAHASPNSKQRDPRLRLYADPVNRRSWS